MGATSTRREELRAELARHRQEQRRGKYPPALKARAMAYARTRKRAGASAGEIAAELGVRLGTATSWTEPPAAGTTGEECGPAPGPLSLIPLVVRPEVPADMLRLEVALPDGTRVVASALDRETLLRALGALRSPR